jgi:hypothetical protein
MGSADLIIRPHYTDHTSIYMMYILLILNCILIPALANISGIENKPKTDHSLTENKDWKDIRGIKVRKNITCQEA